MTEVCAQTTAVVDALEKRGWPFPHMDPACAGYTLGWSSADWIVHVEVSPSVVLGYASNTRIVDCSPLERRCPACRDKRTAVAHSPAVWSFELRPATGVEQIVGAIELLLRAAGFFGGEAA